MPIPIVTVVTAQVTGAFLRRVCYGMNRTGGGSPANKLLAALNSVDSELSCSVLVAQHMSASSAFVLPVGLWATRRRCPHFHRLAAERI